MLLSRWSAFAAASTLVAVARGADEYYQLPFSTELQDLSSYGGGDIYPSDGLVGPDGPWQAVAQIYSYKDLMLFWPSSGWQTEVLSKNGGGNYDKSAAIKVPGSDVYVYSPGGVSGMYHMENKYYDDGSWGQTTFVNQSWDATYVWANDYTDLAGAENMTMFAADDWNVFLPDGRKYTPLVGTLGFGQAETRTVNQTWILNSMKKAGTILSNFFSMHIGSAQHGQPGSLILGGYDQNRIASDVGTFDGNDPQVFLYDVSLGVESGASPFDGSDSVSIFRDVGYEGSAKTTAESLGGPTGSIAAVANAAAPYLYLPPQVCEAAAELLPVKWNSKLELYTWDTEDDNLSLIVGAPSYMSFVLADMNSKNITIKVPLQVLNLTLTQPLVDTPTQYFPCKPWDKNDGYYMLGRAFLQSAFLAFDYEKGVTYIAQAPGPTLGQSVIKTVKPRDTKVASATSADSFASSWARSWKDLTRDQVASQPHSETETSGSPESPSTEETPANESAETDAEEGSITQAQAAGVAVGATLGVVALVGAAFMLYRRRSKSQKQQTRTAAGENDSTVELDDGKKFYFGGDYKGQQQMSEADGQIPPAEAYGSALPHEMPSPHHIPEAPGPVVCHELPAGRVER